MTSWLKVKCCVNLIGNLYKQIQNITNLRTVIKYFGVICWELKERIGTYVTFLKLLPKSMQLLYHFLTRLSFVVVNNINIRLEQHYPVYIEVQIYHVSIVYSILNLKSAARILCYVLLCCSMPFSVHTVYKRRI